MRKLLLFLTSALPCVAAITNTQVTDATPREFVLRYVAPSPAPCTVEVSESPNYAPLVNDVNGSLFAGSNSDFRNGAQGRERTFVIGAAGTGIKYAPVALNGLKTSRALQTNTLHYYRLTCGADVVNGAASTANIGTGDTFPNDVYPIDPARPGEIAWPFLPWNTSDHAGVIDPVTGAFIQALRNPNEQAQSTNNPGIKFFDYIYDDAGTWTNKDNVSATDSALAFTTANNPLRLYSNIRFQQTNGFPTDVQLEVRGFKDVAGTTAEACLSLDGATCYGPWKPLVLPVGIIGTVTMGDPLGTAANMFSYWINPGQKVPDRTQLLGKVGYANNSGGTLTLRPESSNAFDPKWTTATHIVYDGIDYTVSSVTSGTEVIINGSPASATLKVWRSANFGFMIRKTSVGGTIAIDSARIQYYLYTTHPTNGGSGSNLPCTKARYHEGWRVGGPQHVYTNAATNTAPIVIRTTTNHDFVTGDIVKVYNVPGNTAANGNWTITVTDANHFSLNGSNGTASGAFPSDVNNSVGNNGGGLVYRSGGPRGEAKTGCLCFMLTGDGSLNWYWMNPDTTPAEVRFLGPTYTYAHHGMPGVAGFGVLDSSNTDYPTVTRIINVSGSDELWAGPYVGHQDYGMFQDVGTNQFVGPVSDVWGYESLTPAPNTLSSKVAAFDSRAAGITWGVVGGMDGGYLLLSHKETGAAQNGLLQFAVYDITNNQAVAYADSWSNANCRWCGVHTLFDFPGTSFIAFVPYNLGGLDTQNDGSQVKANFGGPYRMSPAAALNATSDIGDCATKLAALGVANPLNVTGNTCSTITVSSTVPISPSDFTPPSDTRGGQTVRVGDLMLSTTAGGGSYGLGVDDNERFRILGISGNTMVVQRGYNSTAVSKASGWFLSMLCVPIPRWWDWRSAPHGETGTDPYSQGLSGIFSDPPFSGASHYFTHNALSLDDSGGGGTLTSVIPGFTCPNVAGGSAPYAFRTWPWPDHLNAPASAYGCTQGNPEFDGRAGIGQGNFLEKHPSPVDDQVYNKSFFDARPYGLLSGEKPQVVTKVGTYVYKVTAYNRENAGDPDSYDEKRNVVLVAIGHRPALNVSAAAFTLPDSAAYWYTYCLVHTAGECWSGSQPGEVYVNSPFAAKAPAGYSPGGVNIGGQYRCLQKGEPWSDLNLDDICVTRQAAYAENIVQYSSMHDPFNTGGRRISGGLNMTRTTNNLWNTPPTYDAKWAVNWGGIINDGWGLSTLVKIPPYPGPQRGINHGTWIPIPLKIANVPRGTDNVTVEFGYNPSLFCTTRQEVCVANGAGITASVYSYANSDSYLGLTCSSGCIPVIPATPQRLMWYRVKYRNSANTVIKVGDVRIMATP